MRPLVSPPPQRDASTHLPPSPILTQSPALVPLLNQAAQGSVATVFWDYVFSPSRAGVIAAMDAAARSHTVSGGPLTGPTGPTGRDGKGFGALSPLQRDGLRVYVASCEPLAQLAAPECAALRQVPSRALKKALPSPTRRGPVPV